MILVEEPEREEKNKSLKKWIDIPRWAVTEMFKGVLCLGSLGLSVRSKKEKWCGWLGSLILPGELQKVCCNRQVRFKPNCLGCV